MTHSVLVTGGAGYIGSHVVQMLHDRGASVVVLDRVGPAQAIDDVAYVRGDITHAPVVERLFARNSFDAVLHFAAEKSVEGSMREPQRHFATNVCGSLVVLEAAWRAGVRAFISSSSCAVYGIPRQVPVTESALIQPQNPYGESKAMVERILHWFDIALSVRHVSLRYFNAAGATRDGRLGEDPNRAEALLPRAVMSALGQRGPLEVFGTDYQTPDGTAIRDYVHVTDLAEAHVAALEYVLTGGVSTTLNLGTGHGSSVRDVIGAVETVAGCPVPTIDRPRRLGDVAALWADSSLAERILGWQAQRTLHDMVASTWLWFERQDSADGT